MGLIRKQIGSDSPKEQVEKWSVKYANHPVMFGSFYNPDKVLFKVNENHDNVLWELMALYSRGEVNEFVVFDFCNISDVKIICQGIEPQKMATVLSMVDKHILNLNEVNMYRCEIGFKEPFKIKRCGDGDWVVEYD